MPPNYDEIADDVRKKVIEDFLSYLKSRELSICQWIQTKEGAMLWPVSTEAIAGYATRE